MTPEEKARVKIDRWFVIVSGFRMVTQWLTHAFECLRADSTEDEITALLPYNYRKSQE